MALTFLKHFMRIPGLIASKHLLLFFLFNSFLGLSGADAQLVCKDEMLINPYYNCGTTFEPVCACDGETYRNQCSAVQHGGIQGNQWVSGPCQEFYYFIFPTLCQNGNLTFRLQSKNRGRYTMYLISTFGKIERQQQFDVGTSATTNFDMDVSTFQAGIYFMVIQGNTQTQIERFVVLPS
ncbi:MAG TPA: hypothetical protein DIW47_11780 [Bacteroidetes bacterium]|nr:hypothetical protein [Bacteroidota bacterium]